MTVRNQNITNVSSSTSDLVNVAERRFIWFVTRTGRCDVSSTIDHNFFNPLLLANSSSSLAHYQTQNMLNGSGIKIFSGTSKPFSSFHQRREGVNDLFLVGTSHPELAEIIARRYFSSLTQPCFLQLGFEFYIHYLDASALVYPSQKRN